MRALSTLVRLHYLVVAVCVSATACATSSARRAESIASVRGATLQVTNTGADDLQLFLVRSGTVLLIGAVPAHSTRVLWLAAAQLGEGSELELLAKPRSGFYEQRSAAFIGSAGQRIAWVVGERTPSEVVIVR